MNIELGRPEQRLLKMLESAGISPVYLVGGYVRNKLLFLPEGDRDIASPFPPQALKEAESPEIQLKERAYGLGTVVVKQLFEGAAYTYEYTAFRCDNYGRGGGHIPQSVTFTQDIGKDALRRDFTVNALYAERSGKVLDPTGRGLAALDGKKIGQVCPDTLKQDALRILRMVRFACELGFDIEEDTYACAKKYANQLKDISRERIRDEFAKILLSDTKYGKRDAVLKGLYILKDIGALRFVFPQLLQGEGVAQSAVYHAYDVLEHGFYTCAATPGDLTLRLAGLLHDIGKPEALLRTGKMYGHDRIGAAMAESALMSLRFEKKTVHNVTELIKCHMFDLRNEAHKKAVVRMITRLGPEQFLRLCDLREADFAGSGKDNVAYSAQKWRKILKELLGQDAPIDRKKLAVNGNDLKKELGIPEGKQIGTLLCRLHEYAIKKPSQNSYKSLIRYAKIVNARDGAPDGKNGR